MKRKKINLSLMLLGSLVLVAFLFSGCEKDQEEKTNLDDPAMKAVNVNNSGTNSTPILLEDGTVIGEVIFVDDIANSMLDITFNLEADYVANEMRLEVACKSKDIPAIKKGNLDPAEFSYPESGTITGQTHTFEVPFSSFGAIGCDDGKPYYAAAYCKIEEDVAWGNGSSNQGNNRGEIIGFKIECNTSGFDSDGIESAFAYGCDDATCFLSIDETGDGVGDFNRWGWTNLIDIPGTYYFDIYAGAGQCNLSNGVIVGELIVYYDGTSADVTYQTCGTYGLDETHLYIGSDMLPQGTNGSTIALGQFPYIHEDLEGVQTDNYYIENVPQPFYLIAHAVVEGDYTQGSCGTPGCDFVPPCTPEVSWTDFSGMPTTTTISSNATSLVNITLCDGKTVDIQATNISSTNFKFNGGPLGGDFFDQDHSFYGDLNGTSTSRMNTRCLTANGSATSGVINQYTLTWDFGDTPLDHTNFFMIGQIIRQSNIVTITAYDADGTTVVDNTNFTFEWLEASTTNNTYTFYEPLTWNSSTGSLTKGSTTGSNSGYGIFRIPEGTEIGKIVFDVYDSSTSTADEINWGIGCFACPQ